MGELEEIGVDIWYDLLCAFSDALGFNLQSFFSFLLSSYVADSGLWAVLIFWCNKIGDLC